MSKHRKNSKAKLKNSLTDTVRAIFNKQPDISLTHKQVCNLLDIREAALRKLVFDVLTELVKNSFLRQTAHSVYALNKDDNLVVGTLQLTLRGSGFVIPNDDSLSDIFIAPHNINQALDADRVKVQVLKKGKSRSEGIIIEVIERERTQFVGTIEIHERFAFLIPDNSRVGTDIFIPKEKLNGAKNGEKALVKITAWPKSAESPYGEVLEVLGSAGSNNSEMVSILVNQGIEYTFPDDVLSQAEMVPMELDEEEINRRKDFRSITTFTIDPHDAKDFDDALSFRRIENGNLEIGIHIADVSHYVRPDSPMDKEALKRSNSVYLVDRVIPMLPEQLSNMACSLRPNEDKYSFSCVVEIDESGKVYKQWFGKTVIHSDKRFSYEEAQEIIEGKSAPYKDEILILDKIAKILRKRRLKSGAMNIESEEMRFRLDEQGVPVEVVIKTSKDAHKLIEEFMLLANRLVATYIGKPKQNQDKIPFVYRCHDEPDAEKVALFNLFIQKFGYEIEYDAPRQISLNINALLGEIKNTGEYSLIQSMAIRSMAKATYETQNIGHYGLAFDFYTHFTSPIRRYADLVVHRILLEELTTKKHRYGKELDEVCKRISRMERKAVEAERESTKYFQTLFVLDKIGEVFHGTVSGIAEFGLFVKMDENKCEGMVPMNEIPGDRFRFDPEKYCIIGAKTSKEYNFGDKVLVRIFEVSPRKRQIDLEIVEE